MPEDRICWKARRDRTGPHRGHECGRRKAARHPVRELRAAKAADRRPWILSKRFAAVSIGTFGLVLGGCGSAGLATRVSWRGHRPGGGCARRRAYRARPSASIDRLRKPIGHGEFCGPVA